MSVRLSRPLAAWLLVAVPAVSLAGCNIFEQPIQQRGIHLDADQMKQLVPGTSTRTDVTSLIGTPTAHASFDDNTWIYIGERTRPRIAEVQGEETQDVVVMTFDQSGVLRSVRHLDKADAKPVEVVERTTPSPGSEASFLQQLLGNVGRFSPTGAGGNGASLGGGAPTPH